MKKFYFFLIQSIIFISCSDKITNPIVQEEFKLNASSETIEIFPRSITEFKMTVISGEFKEDEHPVFKDTTLGSFEISGPWFKDNSRKILFFQIIGKEMPASAVTVVMTVQIGLQTCQIPITVKVSDFYLATKFETNLENDTIQIPKGGNCLLRITCKDSSNNVTSKQQIEQLGFSLNYSINQSYQNQKFTITSAYRDTINYYIMFSAFPDIEPSIDDANLKFTFYLSNKSLILPIKLIY